MNTRYSVIKLLALVIVLTGCTVGGGRGRQKPQVSLETVKMAMANDAEAQVMLGAKFYESRDYTEAVEWFRKSAEQENMIAQHNLGIVYERGHGVPEDYVEAARWHRKSAEQGYAEAQYSLGLAYYQGKGVLQDYAEAARWYRKVAEQGYMIAQHELGLMYYNGQGVLQDYAEAARVVP